MRMGYLQSKPNFDAKYSKERKNEGHIGTGITFRSGAGWGWYDGSRGWGGNDGADGWRGCDRLYVELKYFIFGKIYSASIC